MNPRISTLSGPSSDAGLRGVAAPGALIELAETLGLILILYDEDGRVQHETAGLATMLRLDSEKDRLRAVARRLALASLRRGGRSGLGSEIATGTARYAIRAAAIPSLLCDRPCAGVTITPHARGPQSDAALGNRYGLTSRQLEVARLMGRGRANAAIAHDLGISCHTAERHAEQVLRKLKLGSRAAVAALLNGS